MKSIVFLANNKSLDDSILDKYSSIIKESDILHFNKPLFKSYLLKNNRNFIFLSQKDNGWFGFNDLDVDFFDAVYFGCKDINIKLPYTNPKFKKLDANYKFKYDSLSDYCCPSAGFYCFNHFINQYNTIYLIGFTFEGWHGHNWEYEKEIISNHYKTIILC